MKKVDSFDRQCFHLTHVRAMRFMSALAVLHFDLALRGEARSAKNCSSEMANKIVVLLHQCPKAYIRWVAMSHGLPLCGLNQTGHARRKPKEKP